MKKCKSPICTKLVNLKGRYVVIDDNYYCCWDCARSHGNQSYKISFVSPFVDKEKVK